ncbi:MAG TPA: SDR family oxidoreductase [Gammaproteobacteria bacterium]
MDPKLFSLGGRVAMVTGASSGLGRHFAGTLAAAGARVVLGARRRAAVEERAADIVNAGGDACAVYLDVLDGDSVERAFDAVETRYGTVDVLVNNAGVASADRALEVDDATWDRVVDTNLKGAWRVARAAARRMVDAGCEGSIINVVSILAFRVAGGMTPYAASKAGLLQLTRAMALELARYRIRVNAIAPGYFTTDMNREFFDSEAGKAMVKRIPQRRVGEPADLDGALLLLASRASAYMTGSTLVVDGGHLCSTL